jgi:PAS domain S-box-containing protein
MKNSHPPPVRKRVQRQRIREVPRHELSVLTALAGFSLSWNWGQDTEHRFTHFADAPVAVDDSVISGVYPQGAIGLCLWEIPGVAPRDTSWAAHRAVLDARQGFKDFEYIQMLGGDPPCYFSVSGVPLFNRQNHFTGYAGTTRSIIEGKRDPAFFQSLTRLSCDWYWEIDRLFRFTEMSAGGTDALKSLPGDFIGKTHWEIDDSARNKSAWALHRIQLERHEPFLDFEYERVDSDGKRVVLCISGEPTWSITGSFTGYRGVGTDISARRQAETALRVSEARGHAVVAALTEGVIVRDADGRIIDCNASAERFYGKTLGEMKGQTSVAPDWQVLREDRSPMPEEEWPSVVARRTNLPQTEVVIRYLKPDGSDLWALVNLQPLFDGSSTMASGFVSTVTDISERKRAKIEVVRLNVELENRVLRRTAQLEAINSELKAFSYSVAHDLRAPLSAISGFSLLLQKSLPVESGESSHHFLDRILSGVQRMGQLTEGFLSLANLSRTSLDRVSVDLSVEAASVMMQCAENALGRVAQTTVDSGIRVMADIALLRQVLENLIGNAWKFTSNKLTAKISVGQSVSASGQVVYFVKDNGVGFDMACANKLFVPFQRLHSEDEFSGSGIGLATVQRIIDRHGGKVWADSAVNQGSTFYFTLDRDPAVPVRSDFPRPANITDAFVVTAGNEQFHSVFEHASIGMALLAIDTRRIKVNNAFCRMLGYSEAELLSSTDQDITHPDDVQWDMLQRQRAMDCEIDAYQWEKRYLHQSGRMVWAHLSCSLVRDADHRPLHFISQIQDISERKQAQQVLRDHKGSLPPLTMPAFDWHWEQDENFRFVVVSGEPCREGEVRRESMLGKTCWELASVNMSDRVWTTHKAQLERHEVFIDFEITHLDARERTWYLRISGVPTFDVKKCFTGYCGIGRDSMEMGAIQGNY